MYEGTGFYHSLVFKVRATYGFTADDVVEYDDFGMQIVHEPRPGDASDGQAAGRPSTAALSQTLQRCYVYLGDLGVCIAMLEDDPRWFGSCCKPHLCLANIATSRSCTPWMVTINSPLLPNISI